jgi:hypothetical protein
MIHYTRPIRSIQPDENEVRRRMKNDILYLLWPLWVYDDALQLN